MTFRHQSTTHFHLSRNTSWAQLLLAFFAGTLILTLCSSAALAAGKLSREQRRLSHKSP